jgi:nitroreductase|tara:strand:+ start:782 stop:1336 length:555 start_codon:yes stop_codon:yes gene_type:complete
MDLDKVIQSRRSVRKFNNKNVDWRDIIECIDAMRYTPMAGNNFSLRFILVDSKINIEKIAKHSEQGFLSEVDYLLVIYSSTSRTLDSFGERKKVYMRQQAGAAIQTFLLKIEEKGLSTCWIGHFPNEEKIKRLLKIPKGSEIEAVFPIGYGSDKKKSRKIELDEVLRFNDHKNKEMKRIRDIDI